MSLKVDLVFESLVFGLSELLEPEIASSVLTFSVFKIGKHLSNGSGDSLFSVMVEGWFAAGSLCSETSETGSFFVAKNRYYR